MPFFSPDYAPLKNTPPPLQRRREQTTLEMNLECDRLSVSIFAGKF
jgi:hypothetical protein